MMFSCMFLCLVRLPPSIVRSPIKEKTYRPEDEVELECVAEGMPKPRYCTVVIADRR